MTDIGEVRSYGTAQYDDLKITFFLLGSGGQRWPLHHVSFDSLGDT